MAVLPIRIYPDPVLRVPCPPVVTFDDALKKLAHDMVETMHAAPGIGLAANQVGAQQRLAVVDLSVGEDPSRLRYLVNPRVVEQSGRELDSEGCLSIPELSEQVPRATHITVEAQDLSGESFSLEAEDLMARVLVHEVDHLDGVLFVDHLRGLRRDKARRYLRRLKTQVEVPA